MQFTIYIAVNLKIMDESKVGCSNNNTWSRTSETTTPHYYPYLGFRVESNLEKLKFERKVHSYLEKKGYLRIKHATTSNLSEWYQSEPKKISQDVEAAIKAHKGIIKSKEVFYIEEPKPNSKSLEIFSLPQFNEREIIELTLRDKWASDWHDIFTERSNKTREEYFAITLKNAKKASKEFKINIKQKNGLQLTFPYGHPVIFPGNNATDLSHLIITDICFHYSKQFLELASITITLGFIENDISIINFWKNLCSIYNSVLPLPDNVNENGEIIYPLIKK